MNSTTSRPPAATPRTDAECFREPDGNPADWVVPADFARRLERERVELPNDRVPVGPIPGVGYATRRLRFADDAFFDEAESFIARADEMERAMCATMQTALIHGCNQSELEIARSALTRYALKKETRK